jgi:D-alanine-D-alanine ligase-like ATP-grasp enzyme
MSGTNVWLKLNQTKEYEAIPYLLDLHHDVWKLPYAYMLHHTAEEMIERCEMSNELEKKAFPLVMEIRHRLGLKPIGELEKPVKMSLLQFLESIKGFLFIALHGGIGEDGTLQSMLEERGIIYNGSDPTVSARCMDKHASALIVSGMQDRDILAMPQISFEASPLFGQRDKIEKLWNSASTCFETEVLLIKPRNDGCSAGVARLNSIDDLIAYLLAIEKGMKVLPSYTLEGQINPLEMPLKNEIPFLLEPFIVTDQIYIDGVDLCHKTVSGWCEMTIGVLEKMGEYLALNPSITIAKNHVLSVEEKFQGGTGVNLTPPPLEILSERAKAKVQESVIKLSRRIGISNYARFDLFVECATGKVRLIEINTLPALTPSTVLYHEALTLDPPLFPKELLSMVITQAKWSRLEKQIKKLSLEIREPNFLNR